MKIFKNLLSVWLCLVLASSLGAQVPPLVASDFLQVGDHDSLFILGLTPVSNDLEADTGSHITWDFSQVGIPALSSPGKIHYQAPSTSLKQAYPMANMQEVFYAFGDTSHSLYQWDSDSLKLYLKQSGPYFPSPRISHSFSSGLKVAVFPMQFMQSFHSNPMPDSASSIMRRTIWRYDGYGTVITPYGDTLGPAARIRQLTIDSSLVTVGKVDTNLTYLWLGMGSRRVLMRMFLINGQPGNYEYRMAFNTEKNNTISLPESPLSNLSVYPNPNPGVLRFTEPVLEVEILSVLGQSVLKEAAPEPIDKWRLPPSLQNGFYLLRLKSTEDERVMRLQVLR